MMARKTGHLRVLDRLEPPDLWHKIPDRTPRHVPPVGRARRIVAGAVAIALTAAAVALTVRSFRTTEESPDPAAVVENGLIAFSSRGDIFVMEADGSGRTNLTRSEDASEFDPAWSPDGSQIAFVGCRDCITSDVYVMNADGTGVLRITRDEALDSSPAWSPDGARIAYQSDPTASWSETGGLTSQHEILRIVNADGTGQQDLTHGPARDVHPTWSPDGTSIAFMRLEGPAGTTNSSVFVTDLAGTAERLTPLSMWAGYPSWSPDGTRIAFDVLDRGTTTADLYVMDADGGAIERLTSFGGVGWGGTAWSPDGRWIVLWAHVEQDGIYVTDPDGSAMHLVAEIEDTEGISWQPVFATEPSPTDTAPILPSEIVPVVTATVPAGNENSASILFADGSLWITSRDEDVGTGLVARIDPSTNDVVAEIPVAAVAGWEVGGAGMTFGLGSIWVVGSGQLEDGSGGAILSRIDPATNEVVATIPFEGDGADVAVADTSVWVTLYGQPGTAVARIDPATNEVVATIPLESDWIGQVEAVAGRVFAFQLNDGVISVIDPATNSVVAEGKSPWQPFNIAVWEGSLWIQTDAGLTRLDPMTGEPTGTATPIGAYGTGLAVDESGIWFTGQNPNDDQDARPVTLNRFDPATGRIDLTAEVREAAGRATAAGAGAIWVLGLDGTVTRIDLVQATELSREEAIGPFVAPLAARFLDARIEGTGAEAFLSPDGLEAWTAGASGLQRLYAPAGIRYSSFHIAFVDDLGDGTSEIGVRMFGERNGDFLTEPLFEETLFVGPGLDSSGAARALLVTGGRSGLDGP